MILPVVDTPECRPFAGPPISGLRRWPSCTARASVVTAPRPCWRWPPTTSRASKGVGHRRMSSTRPRPPRPGRTEFLPHLDQPSTRNRPRRSSGVRRLSGRSRMEHVRDGGRGPNATTELRYRITGESAFGPLRTTKHVRVRYPSAETGSASPRSSSAPRSPITRHSARDSEREVRHFQVAARVLRQRIVPARFRKSRPSLRRKCPGRVGPQGRDYPAGPGALSRPLQMETRKRRHRPTAVPARH